MKWYSFGILIKETSEENGFHVSIIKKDTRTEVTDVIFERGFNEEDVVTFLSNHQNVNVLVKEEGFPIMGGLLEILHSHGEVANMSCFVSIWIALNKDLNVILEDNGLDKHDADMLLSDSALLTLIHDAVQGRRWMNIAGLVEKITGKVSEKWDR